MGKDMLKMLDRYKYPQRTLRGPRVDPVGPRKNELFPHKPCGKLDGFYFMGRINLNDLL